MSQCATTNCEDESHKDDFSYCGRGDCSSCGGGCGDDDCSKCNRQAKWVSKAFNIGWSVVKNDREWSERMQARAGSDWLICPNCRGSGMQGSGVRRGSCDDCGGIRKVPPCPNCGGPTFGALVQREGWPKCKAGCDR